jgi:hypothetical protein
LLGAATSPAAADFSARREGHEIVISGDHFRIRADAARGGEITDLRLFDGSQWNRVLGGDGQTCPALKMWSAGQDLRLAASPAKVEGLDVSPDVVRFQTKAMLCAADGRPSPWRVRLEYEVYKEGAVFVTFQFNLDQGEALLDTAEVALSVDRKLLGAAKYREENRASSGFPTARLAFGVNPQRSFTNELQAIVEYKTPLAGKVGFNSAKGRFAWAVANVSASLRAPFQYRNRLALGLGAAAAGKPRSNLVAQRVYHWIHWFRPDYGKEWYPTDELIDKMAANRASLVVLHHYWMARPGANGDPHADYSRPRESGELARTIRRAHEKGLRVGLYSRGIERYGQSAAFFQKHCKRDWDGLYVDWHGVHCISHHEQTQKPNASLGDVHFSADGSYLPAREYFLYTRKLRDVVGRGGFLIGHQGFGNSGILANLAMDAYLPGESPADHGMFLDLDTTVYPGMLGGGLCMPWTLDAPKTYTSPQGIARMAAWGFYPHAGLGFQRTGKTMYPQDPSDPANQYVQPYWRILAAINPDRATLYNSPAVNRVAAQCSNPSFQTLVYKEAGPSPDQSAFLVIVANLGQRPDRTAITLVGEVLGMSGTYEVDRIDSQTGRASPYGTTRGALETGPLEPWAIAGYKLTPARRGP